MRKVKCKIHTCGGFNVEIFEGKFHQWGLSSIEDHECHVSSYTVAIVERDDGRVATVLPNNVEFLATNSKMQ